MKVDKFIFLADFVVLDMEKDHEAPLIFGCLFLATDRALIDVQSGELTLRVNEEEVNFNIYRSMKFPDEMTTCHQIDTIGDCLVKTQLILNLEDPLERYLTLPRIDNSELTDEEIMHYLYALEALQRKTTFLHVNEELVQVEDRVEKPSKLELKQLPKTLRYAFLGSNSTYLVIISASLTTLGEEKLLRVLRKHK